MNENFDKSLISMIIDELLSLDKDELIASIRVMDIKNRYLLMSLCADAIKRVKTGGETDE